MPIGVLPSILSVVSWRHFDTGLLATVYWCIAQTVGHEIAGVCTRVGPKVKNVKVGDRIGVGAQSGSCHRPDCVPCSTGFENLCRTAFTGTYNGVWPNGDKSYGGYSDYWVSIELAYTYKHLTTCQLASREEIVALCSRFPITSQTKLLAHSTVRASPHTHLSNATTSILILLSAWWALVVWVIMAVSSVEKILI